jgi:hypothetical protein
MALVSIFEGNEGGLEVVPAINIFVYSPPVPFGRASAAWANRTREKKTE